jgi:glycosyltransferase involved in cell wall biosynthesis
MPKAKLAICGIAEKSEDLKALLTRISQRKLKNNIIYLGQLNEDKLYRNVASSFITIYPSYIDSFSLVTLEALACGTPVVAYDIPAIKYTFGECKAVLRVAVGDKINMANVILKVLLDKEMREKIVYRGQKFC